MRIALKSILVRLLNAVTTYTPQVAKPKSVQSEAIVIARVLCILGMVYAHAWTGRTASYVIEHSDTMQGMFRWVLVESIGRSAVPLLGMVSGWLVASSALRRGYGRFIGDKARTILAPLLLWNALSILLVCGAAWLGLIRGPVPNSLWWVFHELFSFGRFNNINVQTPFLRDLFLCMVAAPVLVRLGSCWLLALIGAVVIWSIGDWWFPLFLRPQVLLFFLLGIAARRWHAADRIGEMPFCYAALPFAVMAPIKVALAIWGHGFAREHGEIALTIEIVTRLSAAMLMWRVSLALVDRPVAALIRRVEPYMFLLFCSHLIMMWLFALPLGRFTGPLDSPAYPLFLVAQPFLALFASMGLAWVLMEIAPGAARLLSGGRLRRETPPPRGALATA